MLRRCTFLFACLVLTLAILPAGAREWSAGLYSFPSGHGIQVQTMDENEKEMDTFIISTDLYGMASGRTSDVGVRLGYTHDYVLGRLEAEDFSMKFHAGAGLLTGYVHDHENGIFLGTKDPLNKEMGFIAALSCSMGLRFDFFARKVSIDLGLSANPGVHLRMDKDNGSLYLSFYKNGIYQILFPKISIMYRF